MMFNMDIYKILYLNKNIKLIILSIYKLIFKDNGVLVSDQVCLQYRINKGEKG